MLQEANMAKSLAKPVFGMPINPSISKFFFCIGGVGRE
jgi:hypothetical protein